MKQKDQQRGKNRQMKAGRDQTEDSESEGKRSETGSMAFRRFIYGLFLAVKITNQCPRAGLVLAN
jgi:hypothetical protein